MPLFEANCNRDECRQNRTFMGESRHNRLPKSALIKNLIILALQKNMLLSTLIMLSV